MTESQLFALSFDKYIAERYRRVRPYYKELYLWDSVSQIFLEATWTKQYYEYWVGRLPDRGGN